MRVNQPQVSLVDQGRGLKRLARFLTRQLLRGEFAQLVVDKRQQPFGGLGLALFDRHEDAGYVVQL